MKVVLFSGGVDSLVHLRWAQARFDDVVAVYYDVGQAYAPRESARARSLALACGAPFEMRSPMALKEDTETAQVEFRNAFFLLWAAQQHPSGIVFGMLQGETPPDKTPRFVKDMQRVISAQLAGSIYRDGARFEIHVPFAAYTKSEMVAWYLRVGHPAELLPLSVGCFSANEPMCGRCWSCFNRWLAWSENGLQHEHYATHPAEAMLDRIHGMWADRAHRERRGWRLARAWSRRRWLLECWRQLDHYSRQQHGASALRLVVGA